MRSRKLTRKSEQLPVRTVKLNRMPLDVPEDVAKVVIGKGPQGLAVILGPVNELNKLPKGFKLRAQAVFDFWEPNGEQVVLVTKDGVVHLVLDSQT